MSDLIRQLKTLSPEDLNKFSQEELVKINTLLSQQPTPNIQPGFSAPTPQVGMALDASPFVDPSLVVDDVMHDASTSPSLQGVGQAAGGIAGGLVGAQRAQPLLAPLPSVARGVGTVAAGAAGAFLGGGTGDAIESGVESALDLEGSPETAREGIIQALQAGGEEAAFDAVANTLFLGGGAAIRSLRPQVSKLGKSITSLLEEGGSSATIGQLTDNTLYTGIEKLTRGALAGGGRFSKLDIAQDDAIVEYSKNFVNRLSNVAQDDLTDSAIGKLVLDTVKGGKEAHRIAGNQLYSVVDELAGGIGVTTSNVKRVAEQRLEQLARTGNVGRTFEGGSLLDNVAGLDDTLSFADAQVLRSDLLRQSRTLSDTKADQAIASNITNMVKELDKSFELAGKDITGPRATDALKKANRFWRFGKENLNNDLIKSMMKKEGIPSKIAPTVFRKGNREEIIALRKAVRTAAKLDKDIVFNDVWGKMQASYLQSLVPSTADDVLATPLRRLHKDKGLRKTLDATFTKAQKSGIIDMSRAVDEILSKRGATTGLLNLRQIGLGAQAAGAGLAASDANISAGEATAILGVPLLYSTIATSPRLAKRWVRWATAKKGTALKATALTKLAEELAIAPESIDPTNETGRLTEGPIRQ